MGLAYKWFSAVTLGLLIGPVAAADPGEPSLGYQFRCNQTSLIADFTTRDALAPSDTPPSAWYLKNNGQYLNVGWGPRAATFSRISVPADAGCDSRTWQQERILATALHYLNVAGNPQALQYRHHHIPQWDPQSSTSPSGGADSIDSEGRSPQTWAAGQGLDCSNFTAWVYNYGLGIKFGGNVHDQYAGTAGSMGQRIPAQGPFEPGDLVYLHPDATADEISHVVIFVDDDHIIDSRLNAQNLSGVQIRTRDGWYRTAVVGGWRPITELASAPEG